MSNRERYEEGKAAAREIKETIRDGAAQVGSDVRQTASDVRAAVADTADTASAAGPSITDGAKEKLDDLRVRAEDAAVDLYEETVEAIRERPVAAVLIAALSGAVLALLARRSVS